MKQKYRGFTFIELLVVIVVTVLLFVFIFPIHFGRRYMEIAKRVQCSANLHDLGIVFTIYQNDNRGMNPIVGRCQPKFRHPHRHPRSGIRLQTQSR